MPFPLSAHGRIRVERTNALDVVRAVETLLRDVKASSIAVGADRLHFHVRFLRLVSNWNLLVPIDSGAFAFRESDDGVEVQYFISFRRFFFAVDARGAAIAFIPIAWLWLFALNYFIATLRFPAALRSSLHGLSDQPAFTKSA